MRRLAAAAAATATSKSSSSSSLPGPVAAEAMEEEEVRRQAAVAWISTWEQMQTQTQTQTQTQARALQPSSSAAALPSKPPRQPARRAVERNEERDGERKGAGKKRGNDLLRAVDWSVDQVIRPPVKVTELPRIGTSTGATKVTYFLSTSFRLSSPSLHLFLSSSFSLSFFFPPLTSFTSQKETHSAVEPVIGFTVQDVRENRRNKNRDFVKSNSGDGSSSSSGGGECGHRADDGGDPSGLDLLDLDRDISTLGFGHLSVATRETVKFRLRKKRQLALLARALSSRFESLGGKLSAEEESDIFHTLLLVPLQQR
jgi:hypothetical protein